jgi:hypothetical protein
MPSNPFPISGKIYSSDGTTILENVLIICKNVSNNETQTQLSNSSGEFLFDATNFTSGYKSGDEVSLFASYGNYSDEVVFTISGDYKNQDLTLDSLIESIALYTSIADVRRFTAVGTSEFSDTSIYDMIKRVTGRIDELTGRTWKGVQTVIDEYYDGDDTDILWLNNTDLISVSALSIDDNQDGTYTSVTTSYVFVYPDGHIILGRNAEITSFVAAGPKAVKVSYTYGNAKPTESIKELALLMVANLLHYDAERGRLIDQIFQKVKWLLTGGPV